MEPPLNSVDMKVGVRVACEAKDYEDVAVKTQRDPFLKVCIRTELMHVGVARRRDG